MDMALVPSVATADVVLGLSEKGNAGPSLKPRKKSMTSLYLKFFETSPDGKSRRCKFCKQSYSITTATGKCHLMLPFLQFAFIFNDPRVAPNAMDSTIKKHEETFSSRNLLLSTTEKSVVNILLSYLEPFHKITTNISTSKVPTVGLVLFFMDHVFELISSCRDSCRQEWLKSVADDMAKRARSFCTQAYNFYNFMAAILDPRIKKELIPENLNSEKNLEEARSYFTRYYPINQFPIMANGFGTHDTTDEENVVSFAEEIARKRRRASMSTAADELSQFLSEPPLPIATDILDWWKVNSTRYPRLSVMARDYLAVQGTSVEPDELFTSKGDDVHKKQFCLPYSSMQSFMCINSWVQSGYKFKFRMTEINFEKLVESSADGVKS
ncbi:hypothetical protein B296_00001221 [Ensete ventricosum]|uniref:BED-type domain-containing protein n=1 Tax=Ensete ventricosum TaxID=4639 RepID=A0A427B5L1_ENSVE|nr:hypothetical protein B296_00001221 [Ensete ventricosum]